VTIGDVGSSTRAANTARLRAEWWYDGDDTADVSEGVIDLATGDTEVTVDFWGVASVMRIVGGEMYLRRVDGPEADGTWLHFPANSDADELTSDPADLADDLIAAATSVTPLGHGTSHGDATDRFRLEIPELDDGSDLADLVPVRSTAMLDVDEQGRLRRLDVEPQEEIDVEEPVAPVSTGPIHAAEGGYQGSALRRTVLELWDFGVEVDLAAPDPAQVVEYDDPAAEGFFGDDSGDADEGNPETFEVPELAGPFVRSASGTWQDATWEVWIAPTTDGRTCRSIEVTPTRVVESPDPEWPTHDGSPASCDPDGGRERAVVPMKAGQAGEGGWYVAGLAPPGASAMVAELSDGSSEPVPVDAASGVWIVITDGTRSLASIRTEDGSNSWISCTPVTDTTGIPDSPVCEA
jgi:hypothetical protein